MMKIPLSPPYPWNQTLEYFSYRLIPGVEAIADNTFIRKTDSGPVEVCLVPGGKALDVTLPKGSDREFVLNRVIQLFQPHWSLALDNPLLSDPIIGPLIAARPGLRPLGCWAPFELIIRTIAGQQVTVAAANTIMQRIVERCGGQLTPEKLAKANLDALGVPGRRVALLRNLAEAVADGTLILDNPWNDLREQLLEFSGLGPWTVGYLGIRLGRDMDSFPESDIGLIRAAGAKDKKHLLKMAEAWRPYRGIAATYLWMSEID